MSSPTEFDPYSLLIKGIESSRNYTKKIVIDDVDIVPLATNGDLITSIHPLHLGESRYRFSSNYKGADDGDSIVKKIQLASIRDGVELNILNKDTRATK
jgi:hypothetical protein